MSEFVEWIGAQAEVDPKAAVGGALQAPVEKKSGSRTVFDLVLENLPVHDFGAQNLSVQDPPLQDPPVQDEPAQQSSEPPDISEEWREEAIDRNPDLWMCRDRTVALLRRYMRFSLETGRLPSVAGKEFFRAKVSSYPSATFEDRVIFVSDVEKILGRLEYFDQQLIARIILQEHNQDKAARLLHCNTRTVQRRLPEVLDLLSEGFLAVGLLMEVPARRRTQ